MCQKAVNAYLLTVRFVTDWFATPKMLKNLHYQLFFHHKDPKYDYDNSDDSNVDSDDDSGCISLKLISWFNKYNQWKEYKSKIDKEYKKKINAYTMASNKSVGLVYVRRWKKR